MLSQLLTTVKEDMQILEDRIKDKDLIEKIYLKELESKKAEVARLMADNDSLRSMNMATYRPEEMKLKNKENKSVAEKSFSDKISNFLEAAKK